MKTITVEYTTGMTSTHETIFMDFSQMVAKAREYVTSASVVVVTVETPERSAIVTKSGMVNFPK